MSRESESDQTRKFPRIKMEAGWRTHLESEFSKTYMSKLRQFLKSELQRKSTIFPAKEDCFSAFNETSFADVKVVIIGQDPYHGVGQAHGLCFSVKPGVAIPPSLRNIFKELRSDLGIEPAKHGCLQDWASQGVFLLNATLTVRAHTAGSHQKKGWEDFTDQVIERLNAEREKLVFVLWGSYAQKKGQILDGKKHLILKSPHPSPLSAHRGFLGSRPFSKINAYLKSKGKTEINWQLSD